MLNIKEPPETILFMYGRALFWINQVEYLLGLIIKEKIKPLSNSFDRKTLGPKIKLAKSCLSSGLISKLFQLNKDRIILAHAVLQETIQNLQTGSSDYAYSLMESFEDADEDLFNRIAELAKDIVREMELLLDL